jgi:hypothetical protein
MLGLVGEFIGILAIGASILTAISAGRTRALLPRTRKAAWEECERRLKRNEQSWSQKVSRHPKFGSSML